jgi:hypothetical protein
MLLMLWNSISITTPSDSGSANLIGIIVVVLVGFSNGGQLK